MLYSSTHQPSPSRRYRKPKAECHFSNLSVRLTNAQAESLRSTAKLHRVSMAEVLRQQIPVAEQAARQDEGRGQPSHESREQILDFGHQLADEVLRMIRSQRRVESRPVPR